MPPARPTKTMGAEPSHLLPDESRGGSLDIPKPDSLVDGHGQTRRRSHNLILRSRGNEFRGELARS